MEHFALRRAELPPAPGMREVELPEKKVLVLNLDAGLFAVAAECPHAGAPLKNGAVCGLRLVCPWHQSVFEIGTGNLLEPPSLDDLPSYPVRVDEENVYVTIEDAKDGVPKIGAEKGDPIVIVGAGPGGQAAAEALRREGWPGRIILIGREATPPYDRTVLSKMYLSGEMTEEQLPLRPPSFNAAHGIEERKGDVVALDAAEKTLRLADGETLLYAGAIIATGGIPKKIDVPGKERVLYLRSLEDARRVRDRVEKGMSVVVIGASFIGLEAASALRKVGVDVSVVSPERIPFEKQLGREIGQLLQDLHERNDVRFYLGEEVAGIEAAAVRLKTGVVLPAEVVLAGVGVRPATDFLSGVALAKDGGVCVDERLQAGPDLYATGDVASFPSTLPPGGTWRIEHWRVAMQHGALAARNLAGKSTTLSESGFVPFFWTYHYGERFGYVGHATQWDSVVFNGSLEAEGFLAYYVRDDVVVAAFGRKRERELAAIHELLRLGKMPPVTELSHFRPAAIL